jgi:hypothetical protein
MRYRKERLDAEPGVHAWLYSTFDGKRFFLVDQELKKRSRYFPTKEEAMNHWEDNTLNYEELFEFDFDA